MRYFLPEKFFTAGLIHYWPFAGSTRDIIGGKDLKILYKGWLTEDRNGKKSSGKYII